MRLARGTACSEIFPDGVFGFGSLMDLMDWFGKVWSFLMECTYVWFWKSPKSHMALFLLCLTCIWFHWCMIYSSCADWWKVCSKHITVFLMPQTTFSQVRCIVFTPLDSQIYFKWVASAFRRCVSLSTISYLFPSDDWTDLAKRSARA